MCSWPLNVLLTELSLSVKVDLAWDYRDNGNVTIFFLQTLTSDPTAWDLLAEVDAKTASPLWIKALHADADKDEGAEDDGEEDDEGKSAGIVIPVCRYIRLRGDCDDNVPFIDANWFQYLGSALGVKHLSPEEIFYAIMAAAGFATEGELLEMWEDAKGTRLWVPLPWEETQIRRYNRESWSGSRR